MAQRDIGINARPTLSTQQLETARKNLKNPGSNQKRKRITKIIPTGLYSHSMRKKRDYICQLVALIKSTFQTKAGGIVLKSRNSIIPRTFHMIMSIIGVAINDYLQLQNKSKNITIIKSLYHIKAGVAHANSA